jgi:hypothetical protein
LRHVFANFVILKTTELFWLVTESVRNRIVSLQKSRKRWDF